MDDRISQVSQVDHLPVNGLDASRLLAQRFDVRGLGGDLGGEAIALVDHPLQPPFVGPGQPGPQPVPLVRGQRDRHHERQGDRRELRPPGNQPRPGNI